MKFPGEKENRNTLLDITSSSPIFKSYACTRVPNHYPILIEAQTRRGDTIRPTTRNINKCKLEEYRKAQNNPTDE